MTRYMQDKTIREIKELFNETDIEELPSFIEKYRLDQRKGVKALCRRATKQIKLYELEKKRVESMYELSKKLGGDGLVVGLDEVGRGPLAGPLTVACVALPDEPIIIDLNDSKKLSPKKREKVAIQIAEHAIAIGIAHVSAKDIDKFGITYALRYAMREALKDADVQPDAILIDGRPLGAFENEICYIDGDAYIAPIAAASIIAKVTRDTMMVNYESIYPGYDFANSKGYGSKKHIEAIKKLGFSPIHRKSFCKNINIQSNK